MARGLIQPPRLYLSLECAWGAWRENIHDHYNLMNRLAPNIRPSSNMVPTQNVGVVVHEGLGLRLASEGRGQRITSIQRAGTARRAATGSIRCSPRWSKGKDEGLLSRFRYNDIKARAPNPNAMLTICEARFRT